MALVFDIETIGEDFERMDEVTRKALTRWIKREAENEERYKAMAEDMKQGLGFSPLTGEIAAIGVFDTEKNRGVVYYQSPDENGKDTIEENFTFKPRTEQEMLKAFWEGVLNYKEFVSFSGRSFDVPFLMIRSAVNHIKPSLNLLDNKYLNDPSKIRHIDLQEQLSFYGAMRRRGSLHLYCRAFGINSPKTGGITGEDVGRFFREKRYKEIADYNSWDLIATWELYKVWKEYLK